MAKKTRTIKVFSSKKELTEAFDSFEFVEGYPGFQLIRVTAADLKKLSRKFPTEDITDQYVIRVPSGKINTNVPRVDARGRTCRHSAYKGVKRLTKGKHHYLVQFIGPIKQAWLSRLRKVGVEPRSPYAGFTYVVRSNERGLQKITNLPFVRWVGHLSHRDRILIDDPKKALPRTRALRGAYIVEFFGKADMRKAASAIRKLGVEIVSKDENACLMTIHIDESTAKTRSLINALSAVHGVRVIRTRALKRTSNDVAGGILNTAKAWGATLQLSGKGEVVAVCDTGLDTGDTSTIHPDFTGRVLVMKSYPVTQSMSPWVHNVGDDDGVADLDSGHGTHVAGSVLGSGAASAAISGQKLIRGMAYEADLVFQAVEQRVDWKNPADLYWIGPYTLAGIPDDLTELFQYAYNKGARIHSNSWGGGAAGEYDSQCWQLDEFVWKQKDFCVVVAAGNDGTDKDGDGEINPTSVTSPATAKNCITAGASESQRTDFNDETYGSWWAQDYPVAPYANAPMADNIDQIVAFSSRGPTLDGRTKPDVVAPGTFILSARSRNISYSEDGWAPFYPSRDYGRAAQSIFDRGCDEVGRVQPGKPVERQRAGLRPGRSRCRRCTDGFPAGVFHR
jgi:hypothetical protein